MKYNGHISLDVWNTLISPNPEFAYVRNVHLAQKFGVPTNVIKQAHAMTKVACEQELAQDYGIAVSAVDVWDLFVRYLAGAANQREFNIRQRAIDAYGQRFQNELYHKIAELFEKYPPKVAPETVEAVRAIHEAGATLHIASNTNFISGHIMKPFMKKHFGATTFRSQTYSDQLQFAKPSAAFFHHILSNMGNTSHHEHMPVHIGDDAAYDCGAASVGIRPILVKDPLDTAVILNSLIKTKTEV
jgi:FMN phosphatase YigB (HAD superfamily)